MKRFLWVVLVVVLLLAASGAVLQYARQPELFPVGSKSELLLQSGPMQVQKYEVVFIDDSRPVKTNDDAGDAARRVAGMVWHPASNAKGPYPVVVYSHGFTSDQGEGLHLAEQLASLGYVVVAINYPLATLPAPGGPSLKDSMNPAADIGFIINSLLLQSNTPGHELEGMVDGTRIGVTGSPLGEFFSS